MHMDTQTFDESTTDAELMCTRNAGAKIANPICQKQTLHVSFGGDLFVIPIIHNKYAYSHH